MRTTTKPKSVEPAPASGETAKAARPRRKVKAAPDPDFFTVADLAAKLRCSTKSIRRRIEAERIPARREGGRLLIARGDYYAYVAGLQ